MVICNSTAVDLASTNGKVGLGVQVKVGLGSGILVVTGDGEREGVDEIGMNVAVNVD